MNTNHRMSINIYGLLFFAFIALTFYLSVPLLSEYDISTTWGGLAIAGTVLMIINNYIPIEDEKIKSNIFSSIIFINSLIAINLIFYTLFLILSNYYKIFEYKRVYLLNSVILTAIITSSIFCFITLFKIHINTLLKNFLISIFIIGFSIYNALNINSNEMFYFISSVVFSGFYLYVFNKFEKIIKNRSVKNAIKVGAAYYLLIFTYLFSFVTYIIFLSSAGVRVGEINNIIAKLR